MGHTKKLKPGKMNAIRWLWNVRSLKYTNQFVSVEDLFLWKGIRLVDTLTLGPVTSVVDGTQQPDLRGRPR